MNQSITLPLNRTERVSYVFSSNTVFCIPSYKGKKAGSSGAKDSGSNVVLYGSEHLSIEDEGVNTEGGEDDAEVRPQVSFKRGRSTSSKPNPNPKKLKKTKLDLKTVVLEDEVDQVTGCSAAGGLLENLYAHLHGGKTLGGPACQSSSESIILWGTNYQGNR
ncbi:hypothetical protein Hanom_Chr09g00817041 [Helianthus anomalus]